MKPQKKETKGDDAPTIAEMEEEADIRRCDRIPGAMEYWKRVQKMPITGTIPDGIKV